MAHNDNIDTDIDSGGNVYKESQSDVLHNYDRENDSPDPERFMDKKKGDVGLMSNNVGTGKYAKTNIIWYIVSATFVVFSCICISFIILLVYGYEITGLTQSIKDVWGVFTPILTLSLGYLFGKQSKDRSKKYSQKT